MTHAETIAAEVAARYGVAVCPSVVQVCPPRICAAPTPVWNEKTNTLIYPDHLQRKAGLQRTWWAAATRARAQQRDPAVGARRAGVLVLHGNGLSVRQISEALQISYDTSLKDHRVLQLVPNAFVTSAMTQSALRAARIRDLYGEGWSVKRIADLMGLNCDTVRDLAFKHHGLRFARKVAKAQVKAVPVVRIKKREARYALLRRLIADGVDAATWPVLCRVAPITLKEDLRRLGFDRRVLRLVVLPSQSVPDRAADHLARVAERQARVRALTAQGMMPKEMAGLLGCTTRTIAKDKRDMGLTGPQVARELERWVA